MKAYKVIIQIIIFFLLAQSLIMARPLVAKESLKNKQPASRTTYYLSTVSGNDNNDGLSPSTPFGSFEYTFEVMHDGEDTLVYLDGSHYYISPTGSDRNDGTSEQSPIGTFKQAWTLMSPGDTLVLMDGTYNQEIRPLVEGDNQRYIYIKAQHDGQAIIDGEGQRIPINIGHWSAQEYIVFDGLVAKNGTIGTVVLEEQAHHIIVRRVSAYDANVDGNGRIILVGQSTHDNLLVDCVAMGTGRKAISLYKASGNITIRRCLASSEDWDGRDWPQDAWPWTENIDLYETQNSVIENSISYGQVARYGVTIRAKDGTSWPADNNQILGTMSVFAASDVSTNPPTIRDDWDNRPGGGSVVNPYVPHYRVGFMFLGGNPAIGTANNNVFRDVFSYGNASYGFYLSREEDSFNSDPENLTIDHATFTGNTRQETYLENTSPTYDSGELGTDMRMEDVEEIIARGGSISNSRIDKIYHEAYWSDPELAQDYYTDMTGEGARLDNRYVDGVLTNKPLWPWPMDSRVEAERGFNVTEKMAQFFDEAGIEVNTGGGGGQSTSLQGQVSYQFDVPQVPNWTYPLSLTFVGNGQIQTYEVEADETGRFTLLNMTPGEYQVGVKSYHSLNIVDSVTIISGSNSHDFGELIEGDVNNDNVVSIVDFSISATTFGLCEGAADYDQRTDFNGDNCVLLIDFSLLSSNFGQQGDELLHSPF
jgi:hypothetical protein